MAWGDRGWQQWNEKKTKGQRKSADQPKGNKDNGKGDRFPAYDRGNGGGSGSSASSGSSPPEPILQALLACAAKDKNLAAVVESLVPPGLSEDQELKSQQQSLNKIRKLRQRIGKKEAAIQTKNELMASFLEEMKRHIHSEKNRHATEVKELETEVEELKQELALLRSGQDKPQEEDVSIEEMLDAEAPEGDKALRVQLEKAKADVKEAQDVAYAMQAQMQAFLEYQQMAAGAAAPMMVPGVSVGLPNMLAPNSPQKPKLPHTGIMRDPRAPFGVVRTDVATPRDSPYGRPGHGHKPPDGPSLMETPKEDPNSMRRMDWPTTMATMASKRWNGLPILRRPMDYIMNKMKWSETRMRHDGMLTFHGCASFRVNPGMASSLVSPRRTDQ